MYDKLELPERMAIEFRYLGNTFEEIAEKVGKPYDTVTGWFKNGGKLYTAYNEYVELMNSKRQKEMESKLSISDDEFLVVTSNIVRSFAKRMQKRKVYVVDKKGNVVADENGNPKMIEIDPELDLSPNDVKTSWQIQRLIRGLPINYEKQDVEQTSYETDLIMKELGLTPNDFTDENIDETTSRITKHLLGK